jgi:hypothetical protein
VFHVFALLPFIVANVVMIVALVIMMVLGNGDAAGKRHR